MDEQDFLLETERLILRRMTPADEPALRLILAGSGGHDRL